MVKCMWLLCAVLLSGGSESKNCRKCMTNQIHNVIISYQNRIVISSHFFESKGDDYTKEWNIIRF